MGRTSTPVKQGAVPKKPAKAGKPAEKGLTDESRREFVVCFLSLVSVILLYLIITRLVVLFYHPDIRQAVEFAREHLNIVFGLFSFRPEPMENMLFMAGALTAFFGLIVFYRLFTRILPKTAGGMTGGFFNAAMVAAVIGLIVTTWLELSALNPSGGNLQNGQDKIGRTNLDFYFINSFVYDHFFWFLLVIFPSIWLAFLFSGRLKQRTSDSLARAGWLLSTLFAAAVAFVVVFISMYRFPYTGENIFDTNMVYYSVVQVSRGTPMLVDHFKNTYGLYPYFCAPILKLTGLSLLNFTAIMGVLLAACFLLAWFLLRKMVSNPMLALFGFASIFFMAYMYGRIAQPFDAYFAICPIRWLFPFMLFVFAWWYYRNRGKMLYYGSMVVFSLGILWNPDFGLLTYLVLTAYFCYLEFDNKPWLRIVANIALHAVTALVTGFLTFMAFGGLVKLFYGSFPSFGEIFTTLRVHALVGYGMLPMPGGFHPYMLIALIFLAGLLFAIRDLVKRRITRRGAVIFTLTLSGVGALEYYIGRSHNWNLTVAFPWAFLLLTLFADDLLKAMRAGRQYILLFTPVLFILSVSLFQTVYAAGRITGLMFETANKEDMKPFMESMRHTADFIRSQTRENEPVLILTDNTIQGFLYDLSGTKAAINPGFNELHLKADYRRIQEFLKKNETVKIFFNPQSFIFSDNMIPAILTSYYTMTAAEPGGNMLLLQRKKPFPGNDLLLADPGRPVFHKRFTDEAARLKYSAGDSVPLTFGQTFSVQVIFRPEAVPNDRLTHHRVVFTNAGDSSGLTIHQYNEEATIYLFSVNNVGMTCPVIPGKWNYIAFSYDHGKCSSYAQGNYIHSAQIGRELIESKNPVYIGNYKMAESFFFGDIREIKISEGIITGDEVLRNWNRINAGL